MCLQNQYRPFLLPAYLGSTTSSWAGLSKGHMYLVEGSSGTEKTTLGLHFVFEGKRIGECCLYVTLSESKAKLEASATSHGWSLDDVAIAEFVPDEANLSEEERYTEFHPGEVELATTIKKLLAEIERSAPERLVIDSLSPWDTRIPLRVGYVWCWTSFSLVRALPSAASAKAFAPLFGSFIGNMARSDSSKTYMPGSWISQLPGAVCSRRRSGGLPVLVHVAS